MFDMDEEVDPVAPSPGPSPSIRPMSKTQSQKQIASSLQEEVWYDSHGKELPSPGLVPQPTTPGAATTPKTPPSPSRPWRMTPLAGARTDMKDIMAQAATGRTSTLSQGLASSRASISEGLTPMSLPAPKMSQKDRKRLAHTQPSVQATPQPEPRPDSPPIPQGPAWQGVSAQNATKLKDVLNSPSPSAANKPSNSRAASTPQLTMRQTVANTKPSTEAQKSAIGPGGQTIVQQRSVSDSNQVMPGNLDQSRSYQSSQPSSSKPIPQSIRHQPPPEPVLGLSMSEIVAQQQLEKDVVKEAVAKRDLHDIQAEQEFEEWWNRESARVQEAEKRDAATAAKGSKKRRGRGGRGGKSDKVKAEPSNTS